MDEVSGERLAPLARAERFHLPVAAGDRYGLSRCRTFVFLTHATHDRLAVYSGISSRDRWRCRVRRGRWLVWGLLTAVLAGTAVAELTETDTQAQAQIEKLIAELGSPQFRVREAAGEQLSTMGLTAYEALLKVVDHPDIEIRLRSRRIIESLRGGFLVDGLAEELVALLEDYHSKSLEQRRALIVELQILLPHQGADALARLARFEETESLSRAAAQAVLAVPFAGRVDLGPMVASIESAISFSERAATAWLRAYCRSFHKDAQAQQLWEQLIARETSRDLAIDETDANRQADVAQLKRAAVDAAWFCGDQVTAAKYCGALAAGLTTPEQQEDWLRWLLERSAWQTLVELAAAEADAFQNNPVMLYGLAEAQAGLGQDEQAEQTATKALELPELTLVDHQAMAVWLKSGRGLHRWAEAEYRVALDASEPGTTEYFRVNRWFAEMLHDLGRDGEAADLREEALELVSAAKEKRTDKHQQMRLRAFRNSGEDEDELRARVLLFRALDYRSSGDREQELEQLMKAGEVGAEDIDLLIVMFNFSDPPEELEKMTSTAINKAAARYRNEIREFADGFESDRSANRDTYRQALATSLNQYAWLVGNTQGDVQEAIQNSRKSLRLKMGEGGYLDTLARCYYRAGQLEEAVRVQRVAVERAPHELQIHRQLDLFESALHSAGTAQ